MTATLPRQQTHIPSVHDHDTPRHDNTPMIHAPFFSHAFSFSCFIFVCLPFFFSAYMARRSSPCDFGLS